MRSRVRPTRGRCAGLALVLAASLWGAAPAQALSNWFILPYHRDRVGNQVWLGLNEPTVYLGARVFLISGAKVRSSREMNLAASWTAVQVEGGYALINRYSGKCLDIRGPSDANGTPVHQWNCHGGRSQVWRIPIFRTGVVQTRKVINAYANKCLDVPNFYVSDGQILQIWSCNGANWNQEWLFHPAP